MVAPCRWFTHSFLLALKFMSVYVHRSTLPQSRFARQLPQGGSREGAGTIQRTVRKTGGCGRFSLPLRNSKTVSFYHSSGYTPSVSHSLDSSLREGAGDGAGAIQRTARKPEGYGRFSSPLRNSECFTFYHSTDDTPSVSHSLDSSLREGAGNGWCHAPDCLETAALRHLNCVAEKTFAFFVHLCYNT